MAEVVFWYVGEENHKHYVVKQNAEEKVLGCYTHVNVKHRTSLDTRLVFYVNTGVMMYMNPMQTSCLKLSLAKPGVSASNFPPHLPLWRLVCIAVSACKYLTQKDWQYMLVKKRTSFCSG